MDSAKLPRSRSVSQEVPSSVRGGIGKVEYVLFGSSMRLMAPLIHAASRRTTNSKPSLEIKVTYLLSS